MDKYELRVMMITGLLLVIFLIAVMRGVAKYSTDVPECIPYGEAYLSPKIEQLDDSTYQVFMVSQMWSFDPDEIYLPVGSEVDFYLTTKDVVHGFQIVGTNVNMMAVYGGINKATVKFDEPGVYPMICHEYCGSGHQHMQGEIIVNYPEK